MSIATYRASNCEDVVYTQSNRRRIAPARQASAALVDVTIRNSSEAIHRAGPDVKKVEAILVAAGPSNQLIALGRFSSFLFFPIQTGPAGSLQLR